MPVFTVSGVGNLLKINFLNAMKLTFYTFNRKGAIMLFAALLLTFSAAHAQFWTPASGGSGGSPSVTAIRSGRTGVGLSSSELSAFNNSTGNFDVADRVGLLVRGSSFTNVFNIGHLLTGDYGEEKTGDVWTSIGGPGSPGINGLPIYGTRHQFDRYSVNMALADRNLLSGNLTPSGIRDAIIFFDPSSSLNGRMLIGRTLGQGRINPDIVITANNRVGIGTTSPGSRFTVSGSADFRNGTFRTNSSRVDLDGDIIDIRGNRTDENSSLRGDVFINAGRVDDGPLGRIILGNSRGNVGIRTSSPTFNLQLLSNSAAKPTSSFWTVVSDRRLKRNITPFEHGMEVVKKMKPVWFQYNGQMDMPTDDIGVGMTAQQLQRIAPYMVKESLLMDSLGNEGTYLTVDYMAMDFVLVNAMQEQQDQIEKLQRQVKKLQRALVEQDDDDNDRQAQDPALQTPAGTVSELFQNRPNPFNQNTEIAFNVAPQVQNARLFIYNMNGRQIQALTITQRGNSTVTIEGGQLEAGMYIYTLIADGQEVATRRMILMAE